MSAKHSVVCGATNLNSLVVKMDAVRLGILIWLFLPIPVFWLIRHWYAVQIRKYPSTTLGRIVDIVSYRTLGEYSDFINTHVTYVFDVAGTEYIGQGPLEGTQHTVGEEIRVRYNPERPEESRLDDLRDKLQIWAFLGILVLLFELGYIIFTISIGLLFLFAGIRMLIRRPPEWSQGTPLHTILVALLIICIFGLPFIVIGIFGLLVVDGFWDQNILWMLWNH